jgi:glycosyltransferase involved in cell wall biosynthesis
MEEFPAVPALPPRAAPRPPRNGGKVRIVVLYSVVVHYVIGVIRELRKIADVEIDVVHWDRRSANTSQYVVGTVDGVRFHARSALSDASLFDLLRSRQPDIVWVSGWMDAGYLRAIRGYRAGGGSCQVVCGIDDQWKGTLRQRLGQNYFRLFYRDLFDFMWVSGKPQYHYAQRFGYPRERIISNLLSADTARFAHKAAVNRRFVFVGRFDPVKGLDLLLDAYEGLPEAIRSQWPLVLIGDGELRARLERRRCETVDVKPFMQPEELVAELLSGGVACITSFHEQWGVAIHEMALLGYPLILSSACGAATEFLISGYNGYLFKSGDVASLHTALELVSNLPADQLEAYSARSHALGRRISSEHAAQSLLSVIHLARL